MLTYSVVIAREDDFDSDELVLRTYSNEKAAKDHRNYLEEENCYLDGTQWDYVFIRETRIADVFEKGE